MANIREILKIKIGMALDSIDEQIDIYSTLGNNTYNANGEYNPLQDVYYEYSHFLNSLKNRLDGAMELLDVRDEGIQK